MLQFDFDLDPSSVALQSGCSAVGTLAPQSDRSVVGSLRSPFASQSITCKALVYPGLGVPRTPLGSQPYQPWSTLLHDFDLAPRLRLPLSAQPFTERKLGLSLKATDLGHCFRCYHCFCLSPQRLPVHPATATDVIRCYRRLLGRCYHHRDSVRVLTAASASRGGPG